MTLADTQFSDRIKSIMEQEGLSPAQYASAIGVSRPTLYGWLAGNHLPSMTAINLIIQYQGYGPRESMWLLGWDVA